MQGLAQGRMEVFDRFMSLARQAWDVQKATADKTVGAIQDRRGLQPFHEWVDATLIQFLLDPKRAPTTRARVWHNMPIELQLAVFDRVAIPLKKQMDSISFDFDRAFPTPEGIEQHREKIKKEVKEREESEEEDKSRRGKGN
jgi:hypothetical protein